MDPSVQVQPKVRISYEAGTSPTGFVFPAPRVVAGILLPL
jgi:hypothetical protein